MRWGDFDALIEAAFEEDAAATDVTTLALVPADKEASAELVAKQEGVICGLPLAERVVARFDPRTTFEALLTDGACVEPGTVVAKLHGPAASILTVERTMLNFLQRLSGVATLTARYVAAVNGTGARILDTRKTTPGWRRLEKYAVRCGGGSNHRMDLAQQALIKDNHLALAGPLGGNALAAAVARLRAADPDLIVEVEVDDPAQLPAAVAAGPDIVMLDNMTIEQVRKAAEIVTRERQGVQRPQLEASGNITLGNVRAYAEAGFDRISVGALTHSAPALDLSLAIVP